MNTASPRLHGCAAIHRRGLLTILCLSAITAASHAQTFRVNGGVTLANVPTGSQAVANGPIVTDRIYLPYGVSLSNGVAGRSGSVGGGLTGFTSSVQTGNLGDGFFHSGGSSTSINARDQWTLTGASWTGSPRIQIDFEITGSVTVTNAIYTTDSQQSFSAIAGLEFRLAGGSPTVVEYNLRDALAATGGPVPRTVSGTFPIARAGFIRFTPASGTAFTTRFDHYSLVSFRAPGSAGTPPADDNTFRPVSGFGRLQMQVQARITKISIIPSSSGTGSITSPVITSFSGHDYNPLFNGLPATSTVLRVLGVNRTATSFTVQWDSSGGQPTFAAYASDDLSLPPAQWTRIGQNIPNAGATTSFTENNIGTTPRRFYRIQSE